MKWLSSCNMIQSISPIKHAPFVQLFAQSSILHTWTYSVGWPFQNPVTLAFNLKANLCRNMLCYKRDLKVVITQNTTQYTFLVNAIPKRVRECLCTYWGNRYINSSVFLFDKYRAQKSISSACAIHHSCDFLTPMINFPNSVWYYC